MTAPLRIAVLAKQVPKAEELRLDADGRLVRRGVALEMNPYCRRAVAKGVELAAAGGGTCTVVTMGPPAAGGVLREAIAWGATDGVLVSDAVLAGSDTLETVRVLSAAVRREGPFDLVLVGRNSVDADTGQVPAQLAEALGLPLLTGVRELAVEDGVARARCEHDDGSLWADVDLPAVLSCAERLCAPAKVPPEQVAALEGAVVRRYTAADLLPGPWGPEASRTAVVGSRPADVARRGRILTGAVVEQVRDAACILSDEAVLDGEPGPVAGLEVPAPVVDPAGSVAVVVPPDEDRATRELLGAGAGLAGPIGARTWAVVTEGPDPDQLQRWGADGVVRMAGEGAPDTLAAALAGWCSALQPRILLVPATAWGKEVAGRLTWRLRVGLTGEAVGVELVDGGLVGWKPAVAGQMVAAITSRSSIQVLTIRPGVLGLRRPRPDGPVVVDAWSGGGPSPVRRWRFEREDDLLALQAAPAVVGVGSGVDPDDYDALRPLCEVLGAELAATRKVTDQGWLPRARQVGITGLSIAPRLYVAIAMRGSFNHMVGVRRAAFVLAVNSDPESPVFAQSDLGIVGRWQDVVPALAAALAGTAPGARATAS